MITVNITNKQFSREDIKKFVVEGDNIDTIRFVVDRDYDDWDLYDFAFSLKYSLPSGDDGEYVCVTSLSPDEGSVYIDWIPKDGATSESGIMIIQISGSYTDVDGLHTYNTETEKIKVIESIGEADFTYTGNPDYDDFREDIALAQGYKTAAETAEAAAEAAATTATTKAGEASSSAATAASSASSAASSASAASASASAASGSASAAATSASQAATSATSASNDAGDAATAKTAAETAQTAAESATATATTKASEASASASAASTSESNAAASASAAGTSASATEAHKTAAQTAQSAAETAQSKAEEWADKVEDTEVETGKYSALHHAAKAAASAVAASSSETNAATHKTAAQTAQAAAETAQTGAETAQTAAEAAQAAAAVIYDNFDDRYLGAKASDPTTDNDGDPLTEGLLYWNSTDKKLKIYNGTSWALSTANAEDISLADSAGRYTAESVEAAFAEIAGSGRTTETVKDNADNIATNVTDIATNKLRTANNTQRISNTEKVVSQMNPTGDAEGSVDDYGIVALPTNAAEGRLSLEVDGRTATNLVPNGDNESALCGTYASSDETATYTQNSSSPIAGTYDAKLAVTGAGTSSSYPRIRFGALPTNGDIYFFTTLYKVNSGTCSLGSIYKGGGGSETILETLTGSGIYTFRFTSLGTSYFSLNFNGTNLFELQLDNSMLINLTAEYGSGNEPTETDCQKIYADYFSGTKSFPGYGRVRTITKNIIPLDESTWTIGGLSFMGGETSVIYGLRTGFISIHDDISNFTTYFVDFNSLMRYDIYFYADTNTAGFISRSTTVASGTTVPVPSGTKYIRLQLLTTDISTPLYTSYLPSILPALNVGSSLTDYVFYTHQDLYVKSGSDFLSVPSAQDRLVQLDGVWNHEHNVQSGALGSDVITNGDFATDIDWTKGTGITITGGKAVYTSVSTGLDMRQTGLSLTEGAIYELEFTISDYSAGGIKPSFGTATYSPTFSADGTYKAWLKADAGGIIYLNTVGTTTLKIDDVSMKIITGSTNLADETSQDNFYSDNTTGFYNLATPTYTEIEAPGNLLGHPDGSVIWEPAIMDVAVYDSGCTVLNSDYPIASLEKVGVIDFASGAITWYDTADATVAGDGLSFTHTSLSDGDLVVFPYLHSVAGPYGLMTAGYYDRRIVPTVVTDATYSTDNGDHHILVNRAGVVTVTLSSSDATPGRIIVIKDISGAAGTNNITYDTEGSETVDGAASGTLSTNYGKVTLMSDEDGNWWEV